MAEETKREIESKIIEIRMLEEQARQLEEQIALIEQQVMESQLLQQNLDEIKNMKQKEIIVPIGKDVFINSKVESMNSVLVNVGSGIVIKTDIEGAKKEIEKHNEKFLRVREELAIEIRKISEHLIRIEKEIMSMSKQQ